MSTALSAPRVKSASQTMRDARTLAAFAMLANEDIARRLRELRAQQGNPPQKVVAAAMGVGHRTYQTWESAEARPNYRGLKLLAAYYGVTTEYILDGPGADEPARPEPEATQLDRIEAMLIEILSRIPEAAEDAPPSRHQPPGPPSKPQARRPKRAA